MQRDVFLIAEIGNVKRYSTANVLGLKNINKSVFNRTKLQRLFFSLHRKLSFCTGIIKNDHAADMATIMLIESNGTGNFIFTFPAASDKENDSYSCAKDVKNFFITRVS